MNCFHAIMSIKPEFDPRLNEYVCSFTRVEIVSVISLTEYIQKQSVKGIAGIHCKSISTFDLLGNTSLSFSSRSSVSLFMGRILRATIRQQQHKFQKSCWAWWPDTTVYQTSDAHHEAPHKTPSKEELQCSVLTFLSCTHYVLRIWCSSTFGVRKVPRQVVSP